MALDKFQPYLFVSAGEQSNKFLTPAYSGGIASFQAQRAQQLTKLLVQIDPVQSGTGDPSPSNIRPISGRTRMTVTRTGKNLINVNSETWDMYNVSFQFWGQNAEQIVAMLNALKPGTYTFTFHEYVDVVNNTGSGTYGTLLRRIVNDVQLDIDARMRNTVVTAPKELSKSVTFTLTEDDVGTFTNVYLYAGFPIDQTRNSAKFYDFQIEFGTTETAYEPYAGQTYPITWESIAGTVYGGTLDVVSGVLTVDWDYIESYNGETLPGEWISDRDVYAEGTTPTTGAEVAYKLAEPVTYQLDPEKVMTVPGFNQIYSDAGPVIDIKF